MQKEIDKKTVDNCKKSWKNTTMKQQERKRVDQNKQVSGKMDTIIMIGHYTNAHPHPWNSSPHLPMQTPSVELWSDPVGERRRRAKALRRRAPWRIDF